MKKTATEKKYSAPALEKGLDILELLANEASGLSLSQIARLLERSVSEIFRMIIVLEKRGYVALDNASNRYLLTTYLFELGQKTPNIRRLTSIAGPYIRKLAYETHQSVHISMISEEATLIIAQEEGPEIDTLNVKVGSRIDLWLTSSGWVMLAFMSQENLQRFFSQTSIPKEWTLESIYTKLAQIRSLGYEVRDSFIIEGVKNISAPIIDHSGSAVAAITIPFIKRINEYLELEPCRNLLTEKADELTKALGGGEF